MNQKTPNNITAASEAASADMKGNVGNTTLSCAPMTMHIGVFFDGTGNNTENVRTGGNSGSYGNARSNVSLLTQLYKDGSRYDVRNSCGNVGVRHLSLYVQGIGTDAGWSDWWPSNVVGAATGMGLTGVEARVYSACVKIGQLIDLHSGGIEPREVIMDVFGFSRGAAAARYFVNCFRQEFIKYNALYILPLRAYLPKGRKVKFRFVGIFDTVAAIGSGTDDDNGEVNVHMSSAQANDIYHLTAKHEYRTNFRLNHNIPGGGATRELLGAHSDVGGGYRDKGDRTRVSSANTKVFLNRADAEAAHRADTAAAATARNAAQSFWVQDGWIRPNEPEHGLINAPSPIRTVTARYGLRTFVHYTYTTGAILDRPWVEVGLSRIPLKIMYNRGKDAGIEWLSFPTGGDYAIPARLRSLAGGLCEGGALPSLEKQREILRNYGHVSSNRDSIGMSPQMGIKNQRLWHRTVYPNKTFKAK